MPIKIKWIRFICLLAAAPFPVLGAQWTATSSISPEISYTDNVCLSSDNEQGESIAIVNSNLRIGATGTRASFDVGAVLEVNNLSDSKLEDSGCGGGSAITGNRQQFAPRVNGTAEAELWEDWFFIDASVNVDQNEVNPFLPGGGDSLNRRGNTNTFARYTLSPYISHRFPDFANLELRYSVDDEVNSEDIFVPDSGRESIDFNLDSNGGGRLSWGVQATSSTFDYEETATSPAQESELRSARLRLAYQVNRNWQINGFYGNEDNDFVSTLEETDGEFWDVGVRWTPNSRTTVEVGVEDRFFGTSPRFSVNHSYRRSTFSASFTRDLTYDRNIRSSGIDQSFDDNTNVPLDPVTGLPLDTGANRSTVSTSPILDERFTLGYSYRFRRGTLNVNASDSDQTRAEDQRDQSFQSLSVSVTRDLSRALTFRSALRLYKTESNSENESPGRNDNELRSFSMGLNRPLNENMSLSLDYEYQSRRDDFSANEYDENRVSLSINIRL